MPDVYDSTYDLNILLKRENVSTSCQFGMALLRYDCVFPYQGRIACQKNNLQRGISFTIRIVGRATLHPTRKRISVTYVARE